MQIVIKEDDSFRLTLSKRECLKPEGIFNVEFTQECLKDDKVTNSSTYQFFMTQNELNKLKESL